MTQAQAQTLLDDAIAARSSVLRGEYKLKDRSLKPPTLAELDAAIEKWDAKVIELAAKGSRTGPIMKGATPAS